MKTDKAIRAVKAIHWADRKGLTITRHECSVDVCYQVTDKKGAVYFLFRSNDGEWT